MLEIILTNELVNLEDEEFDRMMDNINRAFMTCVNKFKISFDQKSS